jgi:murein DD-endopeptidase MepM/ murein hydrolase activator NlpD
MLFINVHQGDSDALADALAVLDTILPKGQERAIQLKTDKARLAAPILDLVAEELPTMKARSIAEKGACTSWTGSDSGSGANKAPVAYFPFQYNQYWEAGNAGSFWGNYYHGNCNNDYYAVDFNYRGTGSCGSYAGSAGRTLYAVFSGTASVGYDSTGYGYWVKLVSGAYEVLYAHLQQANRFSGSATANVTVIGYTGDSGSATGSPHLHLRIRVNGTAYCNYTAGCPNGEARKSPQGYAYKNMWTLNSPYPNAGSSMWDGACYGGHP